MIKRNPNFSKLHDSYLFPEINRRKAAFLKNNPDADLISLGIGDTIEPLTEPLVKSFMTAAVEQGIRKDYVGYGPEAGILPLRKKIAEVLYSNLIDSDEIFVSDGAKCDVARLQTLFGSQITVGIQDPAYPVYVDGSLIQGVQKLVLLPCLPENNFFPILDPTKKIDVLYICSPNNPIGFVYSKEQLKQLVEYAKENKVLILFDAAYSAFIQNPDLPKSIYEVQGAKEVAIEVNSFSKSAGFTGIRLGWTVVPKALKYADGSSVHKDWTRLISTLFNGASILSQKGGLAALSSLGLQDGQSKVDLYLENARLLREALLEEGVCVYGGQHAPYLWVKTEGLTSWEAFQKLLEEAHIVTTPGSGFGPSGEGFIRLSAFARPDQIQQAILRLKKVFSVTSNV